MIEDTGIGDGTNDGDDDDDDDYGDALTNEQIKELREKAEKAEELETSLAEKEEELEELRKLKDKDINFEKFRNKSKEEKEAIMKKASKMKQMLAAEIEDLRGEVDEVKKHRMDEAKAAVLQQLAGEDADLIKQIEIQEKEFMGQAVTPAELEERYNKAYTLVKGSKPQVNKVFAHTPMQDHTTVQKNTIRYTDTAEGKALFKEKFPHIVKLEEKGKK